VCLRITPHAHSITDTQSQTPAIVDDHCFVTLGHAPTGHRIPAQGATLGIHPAKLSRVLKERRIAAGLGPRPRHALCGVPSEHTYSLGSSPRVGTLGWYALPRWGKWNDGVSIACPRPKRDDDTCGTPTLSITNHDKSGCPRFTPPRFTPEKPDWRVRHIPQDGCATSFFPPLPNPPARSGVGFDGGFRGWYGPRVMAPQEPSG
jgi:hypothetical protein